MIMNFEVREVEAADSQGGNSELKMGDSVVPP